MIERTEHKLILPNLPALASGIRVAHLTDFHRDPLTRDELLREAITVANDARPDLVVLTGDYVTRRHEDVEPCAEIISTLRAPLGVFAVLGNHDQAPGAAYVTERLTAHGVRVLRNEHALLPNGLAVVGLADHLRDVYDLDQALCGLSSDAPILMLCHNPAQAEEFAHLPCIALTGHTHGGQILLPLLTAWKVHAIGAKHYRAGWYDVGRVRLYVNRGLGCTGLPYRFLCPPEVALFTLE